MYKQTQQINPQHFSLLCRVEYSKDDFHVNGLYFEKNCCLLR